jgi:hypothetical protein
MGELVLAEVEPEGKPWSVERRFRVTEVFLAVLWVRRIFGQGGYGCRGSTDCFVG